MSDLVGTLPPSHLAGVTFSGFAVIPALGAVMALAWPKAPVEMEDEEQRDGWDGWGNTRVWVILLTTNGWLKPSTHVYFISLGLPHLKGLFNPSSDVFFFPEIVGLWWRNAAAKRSEHLQRQWILDAGLHRKFAKKWCHWIEISSWGVKWKSEAQRTTLHTIVAIGCKYRGSWTFFRLALMSSRYPSQWCASISSLQQPSHRCSTWQTPLRKQKNWIRHLRCSFLQVASCSYHSLASRLENLNDRTIQCYSDIPWYIHEQKTNLTRVWAFEVDFS